MIVVDDEITSGKGVVALTKALREFGVDVYGVGGIIETINFGAREVIRQEIGLELTSLVQVELA